MSDSRPLAGRSAVVTGSVRGLGLAAARRLAAAGCHVALNGFDAAGDLDAMRRAIEEEHGVRTIYSPADLRRPDEIERLIATTADAFGAVDIVVNNAVVRHAAPVEAFAPADWDAALAVNLSAAFHTIRLAVPGMKRNGWGRIVNVSSIYGLRGAVDRVAYVTTKTALIGLTRAVALETVKDGITCNAVCPGTSATPVHESAVAALMSREGLDRAGAEGRVLHGKQPAGRFIDADRVAALIAFLCGPEAADITGAALPIDGGWSSA
jgi:3-hydroxybutyrate dehydrogenase